jgi:hypothetical protein
MAQHAGVGRHLVVLELVGEGDKVTLWGKLLLTAEWLYLLSVALPKLCILTFYLRVFVNKGTRILVYVLAGVIISTFVAGGLTGTLGCQPLAFFWDPTIEGGHCININAFFRWISLPNILTDMAMLIMPLPTVWKLHLSMNRKIGLTVTFLTGSV